MLKSVRPGAWVKTSRMARSMAVFINPSSREIESVGGMGIMVL